MKTKKERASWPMKDWEVRAILDGSKTQHRVPVKLPKGCIWYIDEPHFRGEETGDFCNEPGGGWWSVDELTYPYGQPGDQLWVRETWSSDFAKHYPHDRVWYAADDDRKNDIAVRNGVRGIFSPESQEHVPFRWRPSTQMPRWASRIMLEIVSVRVERLQDISEADAAAEGVSREAVKAYERAGVARPAGFAYRDIWIDRYGVDSWDANNWVWVEEFKVVQP